MAISAEETIKGIIAEAKKGNVTDHQTDGAFESWKIPFNGATYRVVVTDKKAKTGKAFNKNDLLVVGEDGKDKVVNLGEWKKKLFYTLVYALRKGKVFHKIDKDPAKVASEAAYPAGEWGVYIDLRHPYEQVIREAEQKGTDFDRLALEKDNVFYPILVHIGFNLPAVIVLAGGGDGRAADTPAGVLILVLFGAIGLLLARLLFPELKKEDI